MKALVERNDLRRNVRVFLYDDRDNQRVFYWPESYNEIMGWVWHQEVVPNDERAEPRPTLELDTQMWDAFVQALMESAHVRTDALDIVAETLKLEQERVNRLLAAMIQPPVVIQTDREPRRAK